MRRVKSSYPLNWVNMHSFFPCSINASKIWQYYQIWSGCLYLYSTGVSLHFDRCAHFMFVHTLQKNTKRWEYFHHTDVVWVGFHGMSIKRQVYRLLLVDKQQSCGMVYERRLLSFIKVLLIYQLVISHICVVATDQTIRTLTECCR